MKHCYYENNTLVGIFYYCVIRFIVHNYRYSSFRYKNIYPFADATYM